MPLSAADQRILDILLGAAPGEVTDDLLRDAMPAVRDYACAVLGRDPPIPD